MASSLGTPVKTSGSPPGKVNEPIETSALDGTLWYLVAKVAKNRH